MRCHFLFAVKALAQKVGLRSERSLAEEVGLSRTGVRSVLARDKNIQMDSVTQVAGYLDRDIYLLATHPKTNTDFSTMAVSYKVLSDGFDSWKLHFMEFADEFRRTLDPQLLVLKPPQNLPLKLKALLASMVLQLCYEAQIDAPTWAHQSHYLKEPWFVAGIQSLKAITLVESPLFFRKNNIFVLSNFLERV